jgi:hypothetical protein
MIEENRGVRAKRKETGLLYTLPQLPKAEAYREIMCRMEGALPGEIRNTWRWRILWLRAALDAELKRTDGKPTDLTDSWLVELVEIYHAHQADRRLRPPVMSA